MPDERDLTAASVLDPAREVAARRALESVKAAWTEELEEAAAFELIGRELAALLPCDCAYLLRPAPTGRELILAAAFPPGAPGPRIGQVLFDHSPALELLEGELDVMVCSDTSCWTTDLERQLAQEGLRSALGVLLRHQNEPAAVLVAASHQPRAYSPAEVRLLRCLAPDLVALLGPVSAPDTSEPALAAAEGDAAPALLALSASTSHYFNDLLVYLLGGLEALRADVPLPPASVELLYRLEARMVAGTSVIQGLRQFAAEIPLEQLEELELAELVDEAMERTGTSWKTPESSPERKLVVWHQRAAGPGVRGNRRELCQAVTNVLLNAVEAMPQGGLIRLTEGSGGGWSWVEICDQGEGMSWELLRRACEPFFTTRRGRGRGLGLSVAAGILRAHGGEVTLASQPGEGTTVRLRLPSL